MARHIVASTTEIPPGGNKVVGIGGRDIVVFHVNGGLLRCPGHGWEFDMRTGQSWFDPNRVKVRSYPVAVERGEELAKELEKDLEKRPYVAETFAAHVEDSYVIVEP